MVNKGIVKFFILFLFFVLSASDVLAAGGGQLKILVQKVYTDANNQPVITEPVPNAKIEWYRVYAGHGTGGIVPWKKGDDLYTDTEGVAKTTVNACGGKFQLQLIPETIGDSVTGARWETTVHKSDGIKYAALIDKDKYTDLNQFPGPEVFLWDIERKEKLESSNPVTSSFPDLKGGVFLQYSNGVGSADVTYTYYPPTPTGCNCDHLEVINGSPGVGSPFTVRIWAVPSYPDTTEVKTIHFYLYRKESGGDTLLQQQEVQAKQDLGSGKYYADWKLEISDKEQGLHTYYIDANQITCQAKSTSMNNNFSLSETNSYKYGLEKLLSFIGKTIMNNIPVMKHEAFIPEVHSASDSGITIFAPTGTYSLQLGSFYPVSDIKNNCSTLEFTVNIQ